MQAKEINPPANSTANQRLDWAAENSSVTQEQIRDMYMAGTTDGAFIHSNGQADVAAVDTEGDAED